jgi:hypothetical protein
VTTDFLLAVENQFPELVFGNGIILESVGRRTQRLWVRLWARRSIRPPPALRSQNRTSFGHFSASRASTVSARFGEKRTYDLLAQGQGEPVCLAPVQESVLHSHPL